MSDEVRMLPIVGNLTSELCDELDPTLVKWMLDMVLKGATKEFETVRSAIARSTVFKRTMNAAIASMKQTSESMGDGTGESSIVVLMLIVGWKLAELKMEQMSRQTVT